MRQEAERVSFFLTENERQKSKRLEHYYLYLVFGVRSGQRKVKYFKAAECRPEFLKPVVHFATVPVAQ